MKIKRFNEKFKLSENEQITDVIFKNAGGSKKCPVCRNHKDNKKEESKVTKGGYTIFYKCSYCNFEWFSNYITQYDCDRTVDGAEIIPGDKVNPELFDNDKYELLQNTNKYNL